MKLQNKNKAKNFLQPTQAVTEYKPNEACFSAETIAPGFAFSKTNKFFIYTYINTHNNTVILNRHFLRSIKIGIDSVYYAIKNVGLKIKNNYCSFLTIVNSGKSLVAQKERLRNQLKVAD